MTLKIYSFTTAGAYGNRGPTQDQIEAAYKGTNLEGKVSSSNGVQYWTVPLTGMYDIEAGGGRGGTNPGTTTPMGGFGARIKGSFHLNAGQVLRIIVGQKGTDGGTGAFAAGGGGASVVSIKDADSPMIVAGGGGGASTNNIAFSPEPGDSTNKGDMPGYSGIGYNGSAPSHYGGGGASWSFSGDTDSGKTLSTSRGGIRLKGETPFGGDPVNTTNSTDQKYASVGGFGGGGSGGRNNGSGGGGGGYTGGNGGRYDNVPVKQQGHGGGSFNAGENQYNIRGGNTSVYTGYVTITIDDNNNPPTKPNSFLTQPESNGKNLANETIHLSWTPSTDEDGDAIVYTVEFYNGTDWQAILSDLPQPFYDFMLPIINTDNAQIRISAIDSKGAKSDFLISNVFCIQKQFILVQDNNKIKTYQDGNWKSI
ncbi:glycine-rich protein [Bacillus cereus]|nr:glycine-rich protein [Bacillus cereus]HDX9712862.1 hypothetical protein [Bacillus cereus]